MKCEVEYTDEFEEWWHSLSAKEQGAINATVELLQLWGTNLKFPHSTSITSSKHSNMRELRTQKSGKPLRVLYAFDPRRCAILLIGGDKTGDDRWYDKFVPIADRLYDEHLLILEQENGKKI